MNETSIICPLLSVGTENYEPCKGEQCAWYLAASRRCAMCMMGEAGEIVSTTAIILPK